MPAADPPHRAATGASAAQRAQMLARAVDGVAGLAVDLRELQRSGPSYTIDTVRALREECGAQAPIALLLGADSLLALPTWKDWCALLAAVHLVVAQRPGSLLDTALPPTLAAALAQRWTDDPDALRSAPGGRVLQLHQPPTDASASAVRARIAEGAPWHALVPPAVAAYIDALSLYRNLPGAAPRL